MAADGNPSNPMAATQSGEKTTPPMLDPLYADASAAGRLRTNHGATIALTAAAPMVTQPPPLNSVATKSCHGSCASAQPVTPIASVSEPALVTRAKPKRRYSLGRLAMTIAPNRKWTVTAVETSVSDQPRDSCTACRYPTAHHVRLHGHAQNQGRSRNAIDPDHRGHLLCAQW